MNIPHGARLFNDPSEILFLGLPFIAVFTYHKIQPIPPSVNGWQLMLKYQAVGLWWSLVILISLVFVYVLTIFSPYFFVKLPHGLF